MNNPSATAVAPTGLAGRIEIEQFTQRRARWAWWFFGGVTIVAFGVAIVAGKAEPVALATAAVFVFAMAVFTAVARHRLAARWEGDVVRKEVRRVRRAKQDEDVVRRIELVPLLHVRTSDGRTRKVRVGPDALERYYSVGDRVVKLPGLTAPVKLAPGHPGLCPSCGMLLAADVMTCRRCQCPVPDPTRC
jgi:hypothetical protein